MALSRPDDNLTVTFKRAGGVWTEVQIDWVEDLNDGVHGGWQRIRHIDYPIADLPPGVQTSLLDAWDGMKAHRETIDPIA